MSPLSLAAAQVLLFRLRHLLNPPRPPAHAKEHGSVVDGRDKRDPRLRHLAFLWSDYKPEWYFYEVVDMVSAATCAHAHMFILGLRM